MRIAHLTCVYPPYGGGIGEVARQYAALASIKHQVTVITPRYRPAMTFTATPGVNLEVRRPWLALGKAARLAGLIKRLADFEVVHLHYPFYGVHESLAKLPRAVKLVVTFHMVATASGLKQKLFELDSRLFDKRLAARAQVLTCATRDYLVAVAQPRFGEQAKWQVVPFGVDDRFTPGDIPERLERGFRLRYGEQVVLFVGTLDQAHAFKGVEVLLQAVKRLTVPNWRLVIVGGGGLRKHFERLARTLGLKKQVEFVGYVPERELPDYFRLAQVFAFPSVNSAEAFGLVALQAMASGKPVVASRLPGVRELVREGETGLLVPPGDPLALAAALETLLTRPSEAAKLGQQGRAVVEQEYRWDVVGRKLLALYASL